LARRKARRKRSTAETLGYIVLGAFVVALVWLAFFTSPESPTQPIQTATHPLAPDFKLTDVDGNVFRLSDQRGKVVVIEFMQTTCSACIRQEPNLRELRSKFGSGVVTAMVSVNPSDTDSVLRKHRDENLMGWIAMADKDQVYKQYSVDSTPTIFIIDKNGYILHKHVGVTESTILISEVAGLT